MNMNSPVKTVAISDIKIGKRLRPVNPDKVAELQDSIRAVGLLQPIVIADVDGEFRLVAGRHRLAAVKANKGETIRATVRSDLSASDLRLMEIEENVTRYALSAAEMAAQLAMRQEIIERRAADVSETPAGKAKGRSKAGSVRDLAKKAGIGKDKVAKALARARDLGTDVVSDLTGTSLDKGEELDALVKVKKSSPERAKELVEKAKAGGKVSARLTKKELEVAKMVTAGVSPKDAARKARLVDAIKALRAVVEKYRDIPQLHEVVGAVAALETDHE